MRAAYTFDGYIAGGAVEQDGVVLPGRIVEFLGCCLGNAHASLAGYFGHCGGGFYTVGNRYAEFVAHYFFKQAATASYGQHPPGISQG